MRKIAQLLVTPLFLNLASMAQATLPGQGAESILVLSGGGSPSGNHYSQYLQTKTLYDFTAAEFGAENVKLFFAAGNRPDSYRPIPDVHQQLRIREGMPTVRSHFQVGAIAENNPAHKQRVLEHLDQLASFDPERSFFMLVSDHGMPNIFNKDDTPDPFDNNCIDLWGLKNVDFEGRSMQNFASSERCLARKELQAKLEKSRAKRNVFVMTQCYSGGFHQMSVSLNSEGLPVANANICGFTATNERNLAAGCMADLSDPNFYQGYERYMTEAISGVDVVTGRRLGPAELKLEEAHRRAALKDMTNDIPISTADFYLFKWASVIRKGGSKISKGMKSAFISSLKGGYAGRETESSRARAAFIEDMLVAIQKRYPAFKSVDAKNMMATLGSAALEINNAFEETQERKLYMSVVTDELNKKIASALEGVRLYNEPESIVLGSIAELSQQIDPVSALFMVFAFEPDSAVAVSQLQSDRKLRILDALRARADGQTLAARYEQLAKDKHAVMLEEVNLNFQMKLVERLDYYAQTLAAERALISENVALGQKNLRDLQQCQSLTLGVK